MKKSKSENKFYCQIDRPSYLFRSTINIDNCYCSVNMKAVFFLKKCSRLSLDVNDNDVKVNASIVKY